MSSSASDGARSGASAASRSSSSGSSSSSRSSSSSSSSSASGSAASTARTASRKPSQVGSVKSKTSRASKSSGVSAASRRSSEAGSRSSKSTSSRRSSKKSKPGSALHSRPASSRGSVRSMDPLKSSRRPSRRSLGSNFNAIVNIPADGDVGASTGADRRSLDEADRPPSAQPSAPPSVVSSDARTPVRRPTSAFAAGAADAATAAGGGRAAAGDTDGAVGDPKSPVSRSEFLKLPVHVRLTRPLTASPFHTRCSESPESELSAMRRRRRLHGAVLAPALSELAESLPRPPTSTQLRLESLAYARPHAYPDRSPTLRVHCPAKESAQAAALASARKTFNVTKQSDTPPGGLPGVDGAKGGLDAAAARLRAISLMSQPQPSGKRIGFKTAAAKAEKEIVQEVKRRERREKGWDNRHAVDGYAQSPPSLSRLTYEWCLFHGPNLKDRYD